MKSSQCIRAILTIAALVGVGTSLLKAEERLYVENTFGGDITVVDVPRHEVVGRIEVGKYPDDVVASHDGTVLYANRHQSLGIPGIPRGSESGELIAISTATHEILWRIDIDGTPHHLAVSKDDRYVYVPIFNSFLVDVIDTRARPAPRRVARVPVGYGPHGMKLSADGRRLYVGTMFADQLTIVDTQSLQPIQAIPFPEAVRPFDFTRDEKRAYVQLSRTHGFVVVDLEKGEMVRRVDLPALPADAELPQFFPHTVNHGLALSPDEKLLFAAGSIANYVCVYTVPELDDVATIPVGTEPNWIVFSNDGRYCYVTNRRSDDLSVISVESLKEINRIKMGQYPQRMVTVVVP
ncbi:MAG: beta-propeller fold lactonase family protein [Pirellulales bacterium]